MLCSWCLVCACVHMQCATCLFGPRDGSWVALWGATSCNRRCRVRPSFIRCMRLWSRAMLQPLRGPWSSTKRPLRSRLVVVCVPFSRPASLLAIAYAPLERMRSRFAWSSAKVMTTIVERALDFIPLDWPHRGSCRAWRCLLGRMGGGTACSGHLHLRASTSLYLFGCCLSRDHCRLTHGSFGLCRSLGTCASVVANLCVL